MGMLPPMGCGLGDSLGSKFNAQLGRLGTGTGATKDADVLLEPSQDISERDSPVVYSLVKRWNRGNGSA